MFAFAFSTAVRILVKTKLYYAIWSQAGSKLVADLSQTC